MPLFMQTFHGAVRSTRVRMVASSSNRCAKPMLPTVQLVCQNCRPIKRKLRKSYENSAALSIALGLACLVHSFALFFVFCLYLVLIMLLLPREEAGLQQAYDENYVVYQQHTKRLIPFVY